MYSSRSITPNPFVSQAVAAAHAKVATLHRLVQPFDVAGADVATLLEQARKLLQKRGDKGALELLNKAVEDANGVEIRCLLKQQSEGK